MLFLELAAQSVRGFSPAVRVALKTGYTGLKSPTDIPAPLAGLIVALCYPDGRGGDGAFLAPGAKAGRAGLSVQGQGDEVWRIVRDLGGAGGLHRMNRSTNQFEVATQDATEMGQLLRSQVGFPARTTYEQIFTFTAGQLPSRRPKQARAAAKPAGGPPTKGRPQLQSAFDTYGGGGVDAAQARERIALLEKELVVAKDAAEIQFRHDGVQRELYGLDEKHRKLGALQEKLEAARAELSQAPSPENLGLPHDIVERVRKYPEEKKKFNEAFNKLINEREEALGTSGSWVLPIYKDQRFVMSMGAGLALLMGPSLLEGGLRWLAMLSIPLFTYAALLALRFIEDLQFASRESAKSEVFEIREKKLKEEYQQSNAIVQQAFELTNVITHDEFFTVMAKGETLKPQVNALEVEFGELLEATSSGNLEEEAARLKAELEGLNGQLQGLQDGYVREVREIERDLERMRASLGPAQAPTQAMDTEGFSAVGEAPPGSFDDPLPSVLLLGTDLFATDVPTLWSALRDRSVQYFSALTDRRYHGIDVDKEGHATAQAPGRAVLAPELPGKDLDLMYLSVRLTLLEKYSVQTRVPILIEDGFAGVIEAPKQPLFARMLKHIGTLTQVLHVVGATQTTTADVVVAV